MKQTSMWKVLVIIAKEDPQDLDLDTKGEVEESWK